MPESSPRKIRVSAKLVVVAGGRRPGETLLEALRREVAEETGLAAELGALLWIREYRSDYHEFAAIDSGTHHIEFMFSGRMAAGGSLHAPDDHQIGWDWRISTTWRPVVSTRRRCSVRRGSGRRAAIRDRCIWATSTEAMPPIASRCGAGTVGRSPAEETPVPPRSNRAAPAAAGFLR